jgi:hypothetical protein
MLKIFNSLCLHLQKYIVVKYAEVCASVNSGLCGKLESYTFYMSIVGCTRHFYFLRHENIE